MAGLHHGKIVDELEVIVQRGRRMVRIRLRMHSVYLSTFLRTCVSVYLPCYLICSSCRQFYVCIQLHSIHRCNVEKSSMVPMLGVCFAQAPRASPKPSTVRSGLAQRCCPTFNQGLGFVGLGV